MPHRDLTWPELVLHVLAHLESTAHLPSTLYSEAYVHAARERLGPASQRALDTDIEPLSSQLATHDELSRVQLLALLHPTLDAAQRLAHLDLASLPSDANTDVAIRDTLVAQCRVPAELLRCAVLLEADAFLCWPRPDLTVPERTLAARLRAFYQVAPRLERLAVRMLRVLELRGRLWPEMICVGIPSEKGQPSWNHVLWQAAHEATVSEVAERALRERRLVFEREMEHFAVALLARRAARSTTASGHEHWLARLAPHAAKWADAESLSDEGRDWLDGFPVHSLERSP